MKCNFTEEELLEMSDDACLKVIKGVLANKTAIPDFTSMPARYQLNVIKNFIDTAINMRPEDVKDHLPEAFK